jgi:hypothetical protein
MVKFRYEWFLFDYKDGVPDVMSTPFKTKAAAEKTREKYHTKIRGDIGVGSSVNHTEGHAGMPCVQPSA